MMSTIRLILGMMVCLGLWIPGDAGAATPGITVVQSNGVDEFPTRLTFALLAQSASRSSKRWARLR